MAAEKQGLPIQGSGKTKDQVAALGAGFSSRVIFKRRQGIQFAKYLADQVSHSPFSARGAVCFTELDKGLSQSFLLYIHYLITCCRDSVQGHWKN
jgi:hypothetical protein